MDFIQKPKCHVCNRSSYPSYPKTCKLSEQTSLKNRALDARNQNCSGKLLQASGSIPARCSLGLAYIRTLLKPMALGVDCRGRCRWSRTWRYLESLDFHGDIGISRFRTIHASANPRSCTSWKPRALPETLGRERGPQTLSSACHLRTRRGPEALSVSLCLSLSLSRNRKNGRATTRLEANGRNPSQHWCKAVVLSRRT